MANRRSLPLRNAQTASRKTARKASRRPRAAKLVRTPEEMFPEILELPFCKHVGRPPGEDQCDWWSVPINGEDGLADELLGRHYALLTARFLHTDSQKDRASVRSSVLLKIVGHMIERGNFWDRGRNGKHDAIAIGFVSGISDIMRWAYANGTVNSLAGRLARHYGACAEDARKGRSPRYLRKVLAEASETHRRFAIESLQRDREAKP
jgi:hypothetical protein